MQVAVLILMVVLGVTWAAKEDTTTSALTSEQEEQETLLDDMADGQGRIDLARVLGDLFDGDVGEEAEVETDEVTSLEGRARPLKIMLPFMRKNKNNRARDDTSAAEERLNAQDQRQYNNLVDILLRRINGDARKLDPMMVPIMPDKNKSGMDKKKSGMHKKTRYPKLLNLDEVEDSSENDDTEHVESEHNIDRREADEDEEDNEEEEGVELVKEGRRLSLDGEKENTIDAQSRRIKLPKKNKNNNKKSNSKGKGNNKKRGKQNKKKTKKTSSKNNNKNNKNNKNTRNKNSKNKKRAGNRKPKSQSNRGTKNGNRISYLPSVRTSRAEVTGFATLRRDGDVKIITRSNGITEIKTELVTGPVNLKVTRKFGTGKDTLTRLGNVASPQMKGSMVITIDAPGNKHKITKFQILRPSIVTTHGSLAKEPNKRRDNNFLENTLPKVTPVVTKKLMLVARDVINSI